VNILDEIYEEIIIVDTDLSGLSGRNIWFNWNGRRRPYYYYPELYYNYFPFPYSYYNPCVETVDGEIMCYY